MKKKTKKGEGNWEGKRGKWKRKGKSRTSTMHYQKIAAKFSFAVGDRLNLYF
jgi:hypothetical protein